MGNEFRISCGALVSWDECKKERTLKLLGRGDGFGCSVTQRIYLSVGFYIGTLYSIQQIANFGFSSSASLTNVKAQPLRTY